MFIVVNSLKDYFKSDFVSVTFRRFADLEALRSKSILPDQIEEF